MLTIFKKELKSYFTSPIAYVFMCVFLFMFGIYFIAINVIGSDGDYCSVLSAMGTITLFTIPIITMRLLSEEQRNRTDQLLLTVPIRISDIVIGKFLAAAVLVLITLVVSFIQPLMLLKLGTIPIIKILTGYLGFFLLACTLIAIGLFISSLTENQVISAILSLAIGLLMLLIDGITSIIPTTRIASLFFVIGLIVLITLFIYFSIKDFYISLCILFICITASALLYRFKGSIFDGLCVKILDWFSIFDRFSPFLNGLLDLGAVIYFLSFVFVFLFLTGQIIEKRRWS